MQKPNNVFRLIFKLFVYHLYKNILNLIIDHYDTIDFIIDVPVLKFILRYS